MASVRIETWENEYALYDYEVFRNGEIISVGYNYTTQQNALNQAHDDVKGWQTR